MRSRAMSREGGAGLAVPANCSVPTVLVPMGSMKKNDAVTISLTTLLTQSSIPVPAEVEQRDQTFLLWTTNSTYVDSWYPADVERVKIRRVAEGKPGLTR